MTLPGKQTFPTGGELIVLDSVTGSAGGALVGTKVFAISKGGREITAS